MSVRGQTARQLELDQICAADDDDDFAPVTAAGRAALSKRAKGQAAEADSVKAVLAARLADSSSKVGCEAGSSSSSSLDADRKIDVPLPGIDDDGFVLDPSEDNASPAANASPSPADRALAAADAKLGDDLDDEDDDGSCEPASQGSDVSESSNWSPAGGGHGREEQRARATAMAVMQREHLQRTAEVATMNVQIGKKKKQARKANTYLAAQQELMKVNQAEVDSCSAAVQKLRATQRTLSGENKAAAKARNKAARNLRIAEQLQEKLLERVSSLTKKLEQLSAATAVAKAERDKAESHIVAGAHGGALRAVILVRPPAPPRPAHTHATPLA